MLLPCYSVLGIARNMRFVLICCSFVTLFVASISSEIVLYNARELIVPINYQREKLLSQQVDLAKYEGEMVYLEGTERET